MISIFNIINPIHILTFVITSSLALLYILTILWNPNFRNRNNLFTLNLSVAVIFCITYWFFYYIVVNNYPELLVRDSICVALNYFELMCTIQVPLAMISLSVYRLLYVVYHQKAFIRRREWILGCIGCEWILGGVLALPRISYHGTVSLIGTDLKASNPWVFFVSCRNVPHPSGSESIHCWWSSSYQRRSVSSFRWVSSSSLSLRPDVFIKRNHQRTRAINQLFRQATGAIFTWYGISSLCRGSSWEDGVQSTSTSCSMLRRNRIQPSPRISFCSPNSRFLLI